MTVVDNWIPTTVRLPVAGQRVQWMAPSGQVISGEKGPGALWLEDGVYVYYTPLFWKPDDT